MALAEPTANTRHPGRHAPGDVARPQTLWQRYSEWLDRHSRQVFITPAVVLILIFSIFPLVASLILAFSRTRFRAGGYQSRFVGFDNFTKQIFGSEQFHFLGTFTTLSAFGWVFGLAVTGLVFWLMVGYVRSAFSVIGFIGRLFPALMTIGLGWLFAATLFSGNQFDDDPNDSPDAGPFWAFWGRVDFQQTFDFLFEGH